MGLFDLFRSKNSLSVEERIYNALDKAAITAGRKYIDSPLCGMFVLKAISLTSEKLMNDDSLFHASGLSVAEYEDLVQRTAKRIRDTYIQY